MDIRRRFAIGLATVVAMVGGLVTIGTTGAGAAPAPDQVNDVAGKTTPPAEAKNPNQKKNPKPGYDKDDESSSTHKKKKGLDKLNPF